MFEFLLRWFTLMVDVSLKAIFLAGIAGLLLIGLRVRNSSLKHATWIIVFGSLIVLPLLSSVIPAIPITWRLPTVLAHRTERELTRTTKQSNPRPSSASISITNVNAIRPEMAARFVLENGEDDFSQQEPVLSSSAKAGDPTAIPETFDAITSHSQFTSQPSAITTGWKLWLPILGAIWCVGVLSLLIRFVVAIHITRRLVQCSTRLLWAELPRDVASSILGIHCSPITLCESPMTLVPLTTGWWRPCILLPTTWRNWSDEKLKHVLIHELTHLRRGDCCTTIETQFVLCFYWFHPLAWWLMRRLAVLAEECCDDAAIATTGNRAGYARHLLEIASVLNEWPQRLKYVGLAMAQRSQVEHRILAILDSKRPLTQQVTRYTFLLLIAGSLLLMAVAAALKPTAEPYNSGMAGDSQLTKLSSDAQIAVADPKLKTDEQEVVTESTEEIHVNGRVTDESGNPVTGVFVSLVADRIGADHIYITESLAEGVTDSQGQYELTLQNVAASTYRNADLLVRATGYALDWQSIGLSQNEAPMEHTLHPEQLLQVRLIDTEGQPAAGVVITYSGISPIRGKEDGRLPYWQYTKIKSTPKASLPKLISDENGLLTISHIPNDYGVFLRVAGNEQIAEQNVNVNTGIPEIREEYDGTYRGIIKNFNSGEVGTIPLAPARFFEGVVLLGDTGMPAAHARISIWASEQEPYGSMISIEGETDANGRFRLNPMAGIQYGILAYPPTGSPYQIRKLGPLNWDNDVANRTLEIHLPSGLLAEGTVIDADTGKPIEKASVQYYPNQVTNKNISQGILTGWQGMQYTDAHGKFQIPVAPGPGTLLIHAPAGTNYVLKQKGLNEINSSSPGGNRLYAHAFQPIDPPIPLEGKRRLTPTFTTELQPGASVTVKLVDSDGNPIQSAIFTSRLSIHPYNPEWRAMEEMAKNGRAEIRGLKPGVKYPVYFLDVKRQLGATAEISLRDPRPTIVLQPCASANARFVDSSGKPVKKGERFSLQMVVTPREASFLPALFAPRLLQADKDYAQNFYRISTAADQGTDEDGAIRFDLLIPGATYHFHNHSRDRVEKEFVAKTGKVHDMGIVTIRDDK